MITIIHNKSILTNEDLATMCAEAIEANDMHPGLWGVKVDQYGMFDCSFMFRDSTGCNAIINASYPNVASTQIPCECCGKPTTNKPMETRLDLVG